MAEINRAKASVQVRDSDGGKSAEAVRAKDPVTIVIFGASGDLSKRKLIPALYHLQNDGHLPDRYAVVGFSRTPMTDEAYRESMRKAIQEGLEGNEKGEVPVNHQTVQSLYYQAGDNDKPESF